MCFCLFFFSLPTIQSDDLNIEEMFVVFKILFVFVFHTQLHIWLILPKDAGHHHIVEVSVH